MAASIGWYDTDDTTALATFDFGAVPPGSSYNAETGGYKEVRAKNDGTDPFASVDVDIQQAGSYTGYTHIEIAKDGGAGSPGTFQDHASNPLSLGALGVGSAASVWIDVVVPGGATAEAGQVSNLVLAATV